MNQLHSKIISFSVILFFALIPVFNFANAQIGNVSLPDTESTIDNVFTPSQGTNIGSGNIESNPSSVYINDGGGYQPITPGYSAIFGGNSIGGGGFERMLTRIFELTIYFTVILAVIMMIIGGLKYMGSESFFKKGEGKEQIFAALSGLLIALVSILIISTILPGGSGTEFRINIFGDQ
jgi:hypothetical protein